MNNLNHEAHEPIEQEQEQIQPATEKANPIIEGVKAKLDPIVEDIKEKADPVLEKVKNAAGEAIDAVKDGAEKIGDFFSADLPGLNVKNELFDSLEEQVSAQKDAAKAKAEEMQALLEKMMGNKN